MDKQQLGKFLSLILRHKPQTVGITLDANGWADTAQLIRAINAVCPFDMEMLEDIVMTDNKQRYSFSEDKTQIRANQGHSIPVDVGLMEKQPPDVLFHGSAARNAEAIESEGLLPQSRLYVHLSTDAQSAYAVGKRHGAPIVYRIDAKQMYEDGSVFYCSVNGVWQTKHVPPRYLSMEIL
ncbi:MAG: RNA 2'-phosphotransferase [Clostridia bacterium]|nr:RNA 2'-phosphotransferase [Clostridia bacterium]